MADKFYVTVFLIDRNYGGPEEGGWWYTAGEPIDNKLNKVFTDEQAAADYLEDTDPVVEEMNRIEHRDMYSVASQGEYSLRLTHGKPEVFPRERPHYE